MPPAQANCSRLHKLLAADDQLSVESMTSIQLDDWNAIAEVLTPYLLDIELPRGYYSDGQRLLKSWNYRQGPDSAAAAYFNVVWREVLSRTFDDELPGELEPEGGDRWYAVVASILSHVTPNFYECLRKHGVLVVTANAPLSSRFFKQFDGTVYAPTNPSYTRVLNDSVEALWAEGWLTSTSKVGVVGRLRPGLVVTACE